MRNREISFCNMILCLLVMWIHICSVAVSTWDKASGAFFAVEMTWRLSSFVVQGFLFLSALKLFRNMEKRPFSYGAFLWGRIRKIGVPYLIAVLVSYLGLIWLGYYAFDLKFLMKSALLGNMISPFYFNHYSVSVLCADAFLALDGEKSGFLGGGGQRCFADGDIP